MEIQIFTTSRTPFQNLPKINPGEFKLLCIYGTPDEKLPFLKKERKKESKTIESILKFIIAKYSYFSANLKQYKLDRVN